MTKTLSDDRVKIIDLTGELIRGDWSGYDFDGRDVKKWLETALYGRDEAVSGLLVELKARTEEAGH